MKAAIVRGAGQTPVYGEFSEPVPSEGESRIAVTATAISPLVKAGPPARTTARRASSPSWLVSHGCQICFYTWRNTELEENTNPDRPEPFRLRPEA
jgi:hypothetical protein